MERQKDPNIRRWTSWKLVAIYRLDVAEATKVEAVEALETTKALKKDRVVGQNPGDDRETIEVEIPVDSYATRPFFLSSSILRIYFEPVIQFYPLKQVLCWRGPFYHIRQASLFDSPA